MKRFVWTLAAVLLLCLSGAPPALASSPDRFIGTWESAPQVPATSGPSATGLSGQTERAMVHVSAGGSELQVRLSNLYGSAAVTFDAVDVALRGTGAAVVPGSDRSVRFRSRRAVTIAAGREVLSDPVRLTIGAGANLAVSLFARGSTGPATFHSFAGATSYLSAAGAGNHAADTGASAFTQAISSWLFVDGVDLQPAGVRGAVVTFGDSITDGVGSTFDANLRWPDLLAQRLQALPAGRRLSVLNAGISGNRLLLDSPIFGVKATDRLDRDALDQPGVTSVIVLEGINDIGQTPHQFDPDAIIAAYRQIVARAHARGVRVIGGTLLPFKDTTIANYYTPEGDVTRQAVNAWIRTSGAFDAVVDFDRLMGDPADPLMLNPAFDSGDHLHPSDAGYRAMANAIDLRQLR